MDDSAIKSDPDFLEEFFQQIDSEPPRAPPPPVPSLQEDDDTFLHTLFHGEEKQTDDVESDAADIKKKSPQNSLKSSQNDDRTTDSSPSPPHLPVSDVKQSEHSADEHGERQLDEGVFKRPFTPRSSPVRTEGSSSASDGLPPHPPLRLRRPFPRLDPHPMQKCLLTGIKRKRAGTDSGEIINILNSLKNGNKLLLPDLLLMDYLQEAGLEVEESKVARLIGAAAEHHSACIVQDAMQLLLDGQHERRKNPPKEKDSAAAKPEKPVVKAKLGRPASAHSKAGSEKSSKKSKKKAKESDETGDEAAATVLPDADKDANSGATETLDTSSITDPQLNLTTSAEADDDAAEKSTIKSVVSKDEKEGPVSKTKREREREAEKRHVLTLELLSPVLREQGYHIGRPPYFVN